MIIRFLLVLIVLFNFSLIGCAKNHSEAKEYLQKSDMGEILDDFEINWDSVFLTCDKGVPRIAVVHRSDDGTFSMYTRYTSPRFQCTESSNAEKHS
ncbi:MAG: hypothetical protein G01um101470_370 [Parcubacteria group bacterium Gr01-1014_70]|nr:MAG: hypothetical protein G01um101470_370 [Parcubacteria group bacterium Gr01-1014_70]